MFYFLLLLTLVQKKSEKKTFSLFQNLYFPTS